MSGRFSNLEFGEPAREQAADRREWAPPDAGAYLAQAQAAWRWGEFEPALRWFTRALHEDRKRIAAWVGQVQMLVELREFHEARLWSDKALDLFRDNGELLAARAQARLRLGDRRGGQADSDASLAVPGSSPWRWEVRGELLLARDRPQHEQCFEKALAEPGTDWFDRVLIARIYLHYRRATSALHYAMQALELEPAHGYPWYLRGVCERALGLRGPAEQSFRHCLERRSDFAPAGRALEELTAGTSLGARLAGLWSRWRGR